MQGIIIVDKTRHFSPESSQNVRIMRVGNILRGGRERPERRDAGENMRMGEALPSLVFMRNK